MLISVLTSDSGKIKEEYSLHKFYGVRRDRFLMGHYSLKHIME